MNPFSCFFPQRNASSPSTTSTSRAKRSTKSALNWPLGLDSVRQRALPHSVSPGSISQDDESLSDLSDSVDLPIVNLEEVGYDLYRGTVFAVEALEGHAGHIADALKDEEEGLEEPPFDWFHPHHSEEGPHHVAASLGISTAMLPLSAMAIRAGWHETRHALKHLGKLKRHQPTLETQRNALAALDQTPLQPISVAECQLRAQQLNDLARDKALTQADLACGVSSTIAGSAIFAKATTEIGLGITAKSSLAHSAVEGSAGLSHLAAGAGFASSMVLAPLASISAVSLGAFFLYQSKLEKRSLKSDKAKIRAFIDSLDESTLSPSAHRYREFLANKLHQREKFITRYDRWNTAFAAGSGAYAAGTLTKTGLSAAAIAGGSIAAGPVGLGILAGVGVLGAAGMSLSSHQYFLNHNKHKRYREYEYHDMPCIDRRFLVLVDVLEQRNPPLQAAAAASSGFELRAALYAQIDGHEKALNLFIHQAAEQLGKRVIQKQRSTYHHHPTPSAPTSGFVDESKAILSAASAFGRQIVQGHTQKARHNAQRAYAAQTQGVAASALADWLQQRESWPAQVDYMQTALELEEKYLSMKLATRQERQHISVPPPCDENASPEEKVVHQAQIDLITHLRQAHATDHDRLRSISTLISDMRRLNTSPRISHELITAWQQRFLTIQQDMDGKNAKKPVMSFAAYCLHGAFEKTTAARGILLSVEKQAARLRARFQADHPSAATQATGEAA